MRSIYLLIPFVLAIVVLVVEAVGLLPLGGTVASGPRAEFPEGDTFDFGSVKQGELTTHEFTIRNAGDEPLTIFDVQTGCGCSSAEETKDELAPGEQAKVIVRYEGRPVQSQEFIQARMVTNQADDAVHIMQMTGYVRRGLVAMPEKVTFFETPDAEGVFKTIRLYPDPQSVVTLERAEVSGRWVTAVLDRSTDPPSVIVTPKPSIPMGNHSGKIDIYATVDGVAKIITVPVYRMIQSEGDGP